MKILVAIDFSDITDQVLAQSAYWSLFCRNYLCQSFHIKQATTTNSKTGVTKSLYRLWFKQRLTTIINENGLNTADVKNLELIEKHMTGFFFDEGDYGQ
ncbi:Fe(2+)-trafficking protein, partial [Cardiobacterium sp. AH-315-I02]|nr:Fe(2+)-trafficking protein [Cardiobacterium sp. AH-315-I02]